MVVNTSTGQVRIGVLQVRILVSVPELALHAGIAAFIILVLFHGTLAPILVLRFVDRRLVFRMVNHSSGSFIWHQGFIFRLREYEIGNKQGWPQVRGHSLSICIRHYDTWYSNSRLARADHSLAASATRTKSAPR